MQFAAELINRIVAGIDGIRIGVHVCRGNWSKQEEVLLSGDYARLLPALEGMNVHQFVLEYATPRAGDIQVVGRHLAHKELGLGVINPRTDAVEPVEAIVAKAQQALEFYRPEQLFLNTDCGFACFSNRSVNVEQVAYEKLCAMVEAAHILRRKYA